MVIDYKQLAASDRLKGKKDPWIKRLGNSTRLHTPSASTTSHTHTYSICLHACRHRHSLWDQRHGFLFQKVRKVLGPAISYNQCQQLVSKLSGFEERINWTSFSLDVILSRNCTYFPATKQEICLTSRTNVVACKCGQINEINVGRRSEIVCCILLEICWESESAAVESAKKTWHIGDFLEVTGRL